MDYPLYVLREEPFDGFFPQDLFQWLKTDVSDKQLAEAYAIVNCHCSALMLLKADDDPWGDQAFYDWRDVESEIVAMILKRTKESGIPLPEKKGTHYLVTPFMEKQGYKDYSGNWCKEES